MADTLLYIPQKRRPSWPTDFARNASEGVVEALPLRKGLVAHYDMGLGATGRTLRDLEGTANGSITTTGIAVAVWSLGSLGFENTGFSDNGYVDVGTYTLPSGSIHVECFVAAAAPTSTFASVCGNDDGFRVRTGVELSWYLYDADDVQSLQLTPIPRGTFGTLDITWNGVGFKWYINGALADEISTTNTFGSGLLTLFNYASKTRTFNGRILDFGLWNRIRSPSEINTLYQRPTILTELRPLIVPLASGAAPSGMEILRRRIEGC